MKTQLPERITAIRAVTYNISSIIEDMKDMGISIDDITVESLLDYIEDWVAEDMSRNSIKDITFHDENGDELQ